MNPPTCARTGLPRSVSLFALVYFSLASLSAWRSSPTIDETGFMAAGLSHWETSRFEAFAVNPPLIRMLATLPVLAMNPDTNWGPLPISLSARPEMLLGAQFIERNQSQVQPLYFAARMICVSIATLGLLLSSQWAANLYGPSAATLVAGLWCFSPMMLGHGSLMTPDVGAATFGVLAFLSLRGWLKRSDMMASIEMGICVGLALGAKFTWIPILPPCFLLLWILWRSFGNSVPSRSVVSDLREIVIAVSVSLLLLNTLYAFDQTLQPLGKIHFTSAALASTENQPLDHPNRFTGTWLGELPIPLPICLLQGIDLQKSGFESSEFSRSYLMGQWQEGGWWYYYTVGVLVKSPLPLLILGVLAISLCLLCRRPLPMHSLLEYHKSQIHSPPLWLEHLFLLIPAISLFVFVSAETGFNRHLRYVLPCYPFLLIFISQVAAFRHIALQRVVKSLFIIQAVSVLWHGPHWLGYFNEAAGGPKQGGNWMLVSNLDWGQDFYYLRDWQQQHRDAHPLKLAAYSSVNPQLFGVHSTWHPNQEDLTELRPGWYAVSVNLLHGHGWNLAGDDPYRNLRTLAPTDWAGYSIAIFHIEPTNGNTTSHNRPE